MVSNLKLLQDTTLEIMDSTLYRKIVGSLMYLMNTRPDICFAMNTPSRHWEQPKQVHLVATKHVLRYLKGTLDHGLWYRSDHEFRLYGFSYSDWADSIPDQKSTSGYCFSLGSSMISWSNKKHVQRAKKQYGFERCCLGYLVSHWRRPAFGVTTRVA
jgi:hypothetical protein